jgi:hypothetical protein
MCTKFLANINFPILHQIKFESVAENFLATILAASVISIIAVAYSKTRNFFFERSLKNAISSNGVGVHFNPEQSIADFSVQIHNYAKATIRARALVLVLNKFHVELKPNMMLYQTPLSNEVVRKKFPRQYLSRDILFSDNNPNSILLPPKTMCIWHVDLNELSIKEFTVQKVYVVFEYPTIFGNAAMVRVEAKEPEFKLIKKNFEELAKLFTDSHSAQ